MKLNYLYLLPLILVLSCARNTGIKPLDNKTLNDRFSQVSSLETTNTVLLVQPSKTVTIEIPKEYIKKNISNDIIKIEVTIPATTNTARIVTKSNNSSFYLSGPFLLMYFGALAFVFGGGYLIWKFFNKRKNNLHKTNKKV